jgi:hypothetical protein
MATRSGARSGLTRFERVPVVMTNRMEKMSILIESPPVTDQEMPRPCAGSYARAGLKTVQNRSHSGRRRTLNRTSCVLLGNRERAGNTCLAMRRLTTSPMFETMTLSSADFAIARRLDADKRLERTNKGNHCSTQREFEDVVADTPQAGLSTDHPNHADGARSTRLGFPRHLVTRRCLGTADVTYFVRSTREG